MILVTGCAGFIGSNFVHTWLENHDEPVINLDKLTYAGNLDNLSVLAGDARHTFVQGDIGDRATVDALLAKHKPRAVLNFAAESHVDRSIDGLFIRDWHPVQDQYKYGSGVLHRICTWASTMKW